MIETLLPSATGRGSAHKGEEGRYIEALLREFLNKHLPANIRALSGFILRPSTKIDEYNLERVENSVDAHSRQLDIIVYDTGSFPIYERFEEFVIVPPEGVLALISVKKTLYKNDLGDELVALRDAVQLCSASNRRTPFSAVFALSLGKGLIREGARKCFEVAKDTHEGDDFDEMITEIGVLKEFTVFKFRKGDSDVTGRAKYVNVDTRFAPHVSLQRLINSILSVYHDDTRGNPHKRPGFVSFKKGTFIDAPVLGYLSYK